MVRGAVSRGDMEGDSTRGSGRIKTADKLFRIVETLQEMEGARVAELADELEMANSTVHRYLQSLRANEYVVKEGDTYDVGMRFLDVGDYARNRKTLYKLAKEKVKKLAEETDERAEFLVEEFGRAVFVHYGAGTRAVQADSHLGKRLPLHATSAGKVLLAFLPDERVQEIINDYGLPSYTENTITDEETLADELEVVRQRRVAFNEQEYIHRLNTVSVPVMDPNGQIGGVLGISGPAHRLKGDRFREEIPDLLLGTANELEINVSYQ